MDLFFILIAVIGTCGMLCLTELLVQISERISRRRPAVRPAYAPQASAVRRGNITPVSAGSLPDRESIGKICSLSDHFADRFREVVNS